MRSTPLGVNEKGVGSRVGSKNLFMTCCDMYVMRSYDSRTCMSQM